MQMIQPLQAGAARSIPTPVPAPQQRLVESRIRARQQKILRTALLLLFSAALICVLVVYRSDSARLAISQRNLDGTVRALQSRIDELGWLPGTLTEEEAKGIQSYAGYADRSYAHRSGQPVIIAVSYHVSLLLRPNGRHVVIYDLGRLRTQWMTDSEFAAAVREQADQMRAYEQRLRNRPPELPGS